MNDRICLDTVVSGVGKRLPRDTALMRLEDQWHSSLEALGLNRAAGESCLKDLLGRYTDSGRHYHGLRHLEAMCQWQVCFRAELQDPDLLVLAIFYHDAIYSTLRKDNEARSAALARKQLVKLGLNEAGLAKIERMIRQTASHHGPLLSSDPDLGWFLDFDLSILGAAPATYARYAEGIRKEYRLIPELIYRNGRSKLLRRMLTADFLYYTPAFRRSHERQARSNLLAELKLLQAADTLGFD